MTEQEQEPTKEETIEEAGEEIQESTQEEIIEEPIVPIEEEQEYIDKWCKQCKKERVFITTVSPKGDIVCTTCRGRESIVPFKMVKGQSGYKFIKEKK